MQKGRNEKKIPDRVWERGGRRGCLPLSVYEKKGERGGADRRHWDWTKGDVRNDQAGRWGERFIPVTRRELSNMKEGELQPPPYPSQRGNFLHFCEEKGGKRGLGKKRGRREYLSYTTKKKRRTDLLL